MHYRHADQFITPYEQTYKQSKMKIRYLSVLVVLSFNKDSTHIYKYKHIELYNVIIFYYKARLKTEGKITSLVKFE